MNTVVFALIFVGGIVTICGICAGIAAIIHKTGLAERLWK